MLFVYVPEVNVASLSAVAPVVETGFADANATFEPDASRANGVDALASIKLYLYPAVDP